MSDSQIIDITHIKTLKEFDGQMTANNVTIRIQFANVIDKIIHQVFGKTDSEFFQVFKKALSTEVINDFDQRGVNISNAINDLNILSKIERMIGISPVIFSPTCTDSNLTGWISGFNAVNCMFSSPEMDTEAKARAFTIILFLELRDMLKV